MTIDGFRCAFHNIGNMSSSPDIPAGVVGFEFWAQGAVSFICASKATVFHDH
jgi:hypothetical protein